MEENRIPNEEPTKEPNGSGRPTPDGEEPAVPDKTDKTDEKDKTDETDAETDGTDAGEKHLPEHTFRTQGNVSFQLAYRMVADVSEIIRGWQSEWNEGFSFERESAEPWHFHSQAFLPQNRLALIFEADDEVYEGRVEAAHVLNRFRVLVFDLRTMEIIKRFAFHCQDTDVLTVLATPDGEGIQAVVKVSGKEDGVWTVLPMVPENDQKQYKIAPYVKQVLQFENGDVAASYAHNDLDREKTPVAFWDADDGGYAGGLKAPEELECAALTLDACGVAWAHLMPSGKIVRLGKEVRTFESAYCGFTDFGVSSDGRLMAVSYQSGVCENRMYLMVREDNRYLALGKLDFSHLPGCEDPLECGAFGFPVFYGSRFVFNKDGALYLFDLDCVM